MADTPRSAEVPGRNRRILHWLVASAFIIMVITGLIMMVPSFSAAASGGWTRLAHRIAAVVLIAVPALYAIFRHKTALQWLAEALLLGPKSSGAQHTPTWRRIHKTLILMGYSVFAVTGLFQWFLKETVSRDVFQIALLIHDIAFFSAIVVFLYHVYYEFDWWLWKRSYCRHCQVALCAEACPTAALMPANGKGIERNPERCNNCRLCMQACRRNSYHRKTIHGMEPEPQAR